jgi:hypothetical protein
LRFRDDRPVRVGNRWTWRELLSQPGRRGERIICPRSEDACASPPLMDWPALLAANIDLDRCRRHSKRPRQVPLDNIPNFANC